jgi:hypothetical protein
MMHALAIGYVTACMATLTVVVGMLLLIMIAHLSGAVWFVLLRRRAEAVVGSLPAVAALFLPILVAPHAFGYMHPAPFAARALAYWAVWLGFGERLLALSRRQDRDPSAVPAARLRALSAAGIPLVALALTFASFDWMMSLSAGWSSSVYGAYVSAGAMLAAMALLALLAGSRRDAAAPTAEHFQAVGRLTLAFLLLWAYLWYSQFFIIWLADLPREAGWYVVRLSGGWGVLGFTTLVAGGVIPFLVLAFRAARGSALVMPILGAWLLIVHYADVYWLIVPAVRPASSVGDAMWDIGALAFVCGSTIAVAIWRHAAVPAVPSGDPLLEWSMRYEAR